MKPAILIEKAQYDPAKLLLDLSAVESHLWHLHLAKQEHDGGWSAVPLISRGGKMDPESIMLGGDAPYSKTSICDKTPYFNEIIDGFKCEKLRVRLMKLSPGKIIKEHRDSKHSWVSGQVRMHIPIVTNDQVYFFVKGERVVMKPGTLWYIDVQERHAVRNESNEARVHLVMDLMINSFIKDLFPDMTLMDRANQARHDLTRAVYNTAHFVYRMTGAQNVRQRIQKRRRAWLQNQSS